MSKQEAQLEAIRRAKEKLAAIDLTVRCANLGLPVPQENTVRFRAFGADMCLDRNLDLVDAKAGKPAKLGDHILILHYLLCDVPLEPTGEVITFRDMPGGQFYWQPFLSRSVNPLLARIGNNLDLLRERCNRFDWKPAQGGDFAAVINGIGRIDATLVYNSGDQEFGPAAQILFDACIKRVYVTEDIALLAGRLCLGLL
jgi:hypothetical protein